MSSKKKGLFITFEGGEGTGKSTQITKIAGALQKKGVSIETTREPGGSDLAESIRSLFLRNDINPIEEMLLILAGRHHHIRTLIRPALQSGKWVLCDRFVDSSLVYQGLSIGQKSVIQWHALANITCIPDITFLLHDPAHLTLNRRRQNPESCNRFDQKDLSFHDQISRSYLNLAKENPERFVLVPSGQDVESTTDFILQYIERKWK